MVELGSGEYVIRQNDKGTSTLYKVQGRTDHEIEVLNPDAKGSVNFAGTKGNASNLRFTIYGLSPEIKNLGFKTGDMNKDKLEIIIADGVSCDIKAEDAGGNNNKVKISHSGAGDITVETGKGDGDKSQAVAAKGDVILTDQGGNLNHLRGQAVNGHATVKTNNGNNDFARAEVLDGTKIARAQDSGGIGNGVIAANHIGKAFASTGSGKHDSAIAIGKEPQARDSGGGNGLILSGAGLNTNQGETIYELSEDKDGFIKEQLKNSTYHFQQTQ